MSIVQVKAGTPYEVVIQSNALEQVGAAAIETLGKPCTAAILTDDTVDSLYGEKVQQGLEACGFRVLRFAFPHGEGSKTLECWGEMLNFLARNQLTRSDCVIGLGGGVPGDMAGFAAACYLRGIALIQIPTTLLAMVDSSVGGKTGVDLPSGKNLAGAFYQPKVVLCDPDTLKTLPPVYLRDGIAETIKYGVLGDVPLFELFETGDWQAEAGRVIRRCVAAKARLVEEDEHDTGSRQLLNLGHTLGHAIEKLSDYRISHGHAVAVGMVYATRLAWRMGLCQQETLDRLTAVLRRHSLPVDAPYTAEQLLPAVLSDKKRMGQTMTFVLPRRIGHCELVKLDVQRLPELIRMATAKD